jgi:hypothetical protein
MTSLTPVSRTFLKITAIAATTGDATLLWISVEPKPQVKTFIAGPSWVGLTAIHWAPWEALSARRMEGAWGLPLPFQMAEYEPSVWVLCQAAASE